MWFSSFLANPPMCQGHWPVKTYLFASQLSRCKVYMDYVFIVVKVEQTSRRSFHNSHTCWPSHQRVWPIGPKVDYFASHLPACFNFDLAERVLPLSPLAVPALIPGSWPFFAFDAAFFWSSSIEKCSRLEGLLAMHLLLWELLLLFFDRQRAAMRIMSLVFSFLP